MKLLEPKVRFKGPRPDDNGPYNHIVMFLFTFFADGNSVLLRLSHSILLILCIKL